MNNDLISRSKLLADMGIENAMKWGNKTSEQSQNSYDTMMNYEIADDIRSAPAEDAEIVRYAMWNSAYKSGHTPKKGFICSACDCWNGGKYQYCPHCGAKMDAAPPTMTEEPEATDDPASRMHQWGIDAMGAPFDEPHGGA